MQTCMDANKTTSKKNIIEALWTRKVLVACQHLLEHTALQENVAYAADRKTLQQIVKNYIMPIKLSQCLPLSIDYIDLYATGCKLY